MKEWGENMVPEAESMISNDLIDCQNRLKALNGLCLPKITCSLRMPHSMS